MSLEIEQVITEMTELVQIDQAVGMSVDGEVGEDEAIHAVQEQYGEAGFDCDEETARTIVRDAQ